MSLCNCENRLGCTGAAVIASFIIGIVAAFLQITAVITVTPVFLWVVFGIAIGYLAVTLLSVSLAPRVTPCTEAPLSAVLAGILGTVLFSVILLAIEFAATSILGAVIVGALLFFFALTVTATACLVKCLAQQND